MTNIGDLMKKLETVLNQYMQRMSIDNLKDLSDKLNNRLGDDLSEALNQMSSCADLDKWLSSTKNHTELYDLIDVITNAVNKKLAEKCQMV